MAGRLKRVRDALAAPYDCFAGAGTRNGEPRPKAAGRKTRTSKGPASGVTRCLLSVFSSRDRFRTRPLRAASVPGFERIAGTRPCRRLASQDGPRRAQSVPWSPLPSSGLRPFRAEWANRSGATVRPLRLEHLGGTRAPIVGRDGCPVGSSRLRAPVQGLASIAAARTRTRREGARWT